MPSCPVLHHTKSIKEAFRTTQFDSDFSDASSSALSGYETDEEEASVKVSLPLPPQTRKPTDILECDKKTADAHVPRDARLIRLTGIHPFNCEAPLSALYDSGFITPTELWYVRNHGAVPQVPDENVLNWQVSIEGLVEQPMILTLAQLLTFPQTTIPMTFVCAGNRRKEQNIVRKGTGFNWGSAGVSTALFTGTLMSEIFKLVKPKRGARYMCMEGADQLPNGHYGTSIRLSTATDPMMGVMLAHTMNGEPLSPDHGRPLRVVIPGQIGGRSVKWLTRIIISTKPSANWYHIYDNRVLPTMATPEIVAVDKSWYQDERYALYNLSVQSVTCYPAHEEVIDCRQDTTYTVRGYAYSGGGVRVGRVELSLDQGATWRLATIDYPEDRYRQATHYPVLFGGQLDMADRDHSFCWCFWEIVVPTVDLASAKDLVVRAMDESMNLQPRDMYWNVMSMLNNCWHRLTITKETDGRLKFDHPCLAALTNGGWMEKVKEEGGNLTDGFWGDSARVKGGESAAQKVPLPCVKMTNDSVTRIITEEELAEHDKDGDAWFAVQGHVYDGSAYLKDHPGGGDAIVLASGADATDDFMAIHSDTAKAMLVKYHIGILETSPKTPANCPVTRPQWNRDIFLDSKRWTPATLTRKTKYNHDSMHLTFALEHPQQKLGVSTGQHVYVRCSTTSGDHVVRPYTMISPADHPGEFHLLVKLYLPNGKMSACIDRLKEGDTVDFKGPRGHVEYLGNGVFTNKGVHRTVKKLTMIAGGSGITPIYQILSVARRDGIECDVIYCNKTEEDILLRGELDELGRVRHCLSQPLVHGWTGLRGRISQELVGERHDGLLLCCGPLGMVDAVRNIAVAGGWDLDSQLVVF